MKIFLKGFKEGTYYVGELMSGPFNAVALFIFYIFVVGLTAMVARIARKKFLQDENLGWQNIDEKQSTEESSYRQF